MRLQYTDTSREWSGEERLEFNRRILILTDMTYNPFELRLVLYDYSRLRDDYCSMLIVKCTTTVQYTYIRILQVVHH